MSSDTNVAADAGLKRFFVLPAALLCAGLSAISIVKLAGGGHDRLAWLGVLMANIVLPIFFAYLMTGRVARSSEHLPFLLLASGAGPLLTAWEVFEEGVAGWHLLVPALLGTMLLAIYVFWYSRFHRQSSHQLEVGKKMPEFELAGPDGAIFRSAELNGSPAILVFYRGNWCPLCMAQIREIADRYQDLESLGVKVVLISPQNAAHTRKLAERHGLSFRYLIDESNRLAESLGIALRNGVPAGLPGDFAADTVMPTVVAVNSSGTIVYSDQTDNYRMRPEPDIFIAILRRAGAIST